jgi:hypothetical protein
VSLLGHRNRRGDPEGRQLTAAAEDVLRLVDGRSAEQRHVVLTPARDIRSQRIRWAWEDRCPLRSMVVIAGEKGLGKSLLTNARIPAQVTRGTLAGELAAQPMDVLIVTAEDDWRTVVKPRLAAHGADLSRVHQVEVVDSSGRALLTLPDDVPLLEAQIDRLRGEGRPVGMLVVDPIGAFLSSAIDTHRDASLRRALAPLAAMADRLDLVVVVVAHLTKDENTRLINRVNGSNALVNAARSVLVLARDPDDPEGEQGHDRVLVHVSSNWGRYAPTLTMRIEAREVDLDDGARAPVGYVVMTGETNLGTEDLQRRDDSSGADVEEAIGAALADGPHPSREVKKRVAGELGCSTKTVERAAVRMVSQGQIVSESGGYPRTTTWALSSKDTVSEPVGTSSNTTTVPTTTLQGKAVPTDTSRDSRDVLARDVPAVCADGGGGIS